jgi:lipid-A-disaccharide synthase
VKYYIIAGEASGDLHGSNLIRALIKEDADAEIRCWGGDRMQAAGGEVVKHIRDLAFMGFAEVIQHLPEILGNISYCKKEIHNYRPDVVILIDYPGFNFRLLKFLKQHGFKVFYYISPQLWAWKTGRVKQVKQYVDEMFVIFPFEASFYAKYGIQAHYFGHPLLDEPTFQISQVEKIRYSKQIALVPGSRKQEIAALLPEYLKVIPSFPDYTFTVTGMGTIGEAFYRSIIKDARCELVMDDTYNVISEAQAALVTSGTATLETALKRVPEVVCYKGSWISYWVARFLIKNIRFICIVNLICDKAVVEELIQEDVNTERLTKSLHYLLSEQGRNTVQKGYDELVDKLGHSGASARVAQKMVALLKVGN